MEQSRSIWTRLDRHLLSKDKTSDGQKQAFLAYARAQRIKTGGAKPYPDIEVHRHNRTFSQNCTEEEIETATCVMEAIADFFTDETKYEKYMKNRRFEFLNIMEKSVEVVCIDCTSEERSVSTIRVTEQFSDMPEHLSASIEQKISKVLKMSCNGKVQIHANYPRHVFRYAFDENDVIPTIFGIADECRKNLSAATCVLEDWYAEREEVWETMLDFIIRRENVLGRLSFGGMSGNTE